MKDIHFRGIEYDYLLRIGVEELADDLAADRPCAARHEKGLTGRILGDTLLIGLHERSTDDIRGIYVAYIGETYFAEDNRGDARKDFDRNALRCKTRDARGHARAGRWHGDKYLVEMVRRCQVRDIAYRSYNFHP